MAQAYYRWAAPYYVQLPACGIILLALPSLPIPARKVLLAFTRIRQRVSMRTRFQRTFADELRKYHAFKLDHNTAQYTLISLMDMLVGIEEFLHDPITLAFLSTAIRSAPYEDYSSVMDTKEETIKKEIQAGIHEQYNAKLDFQAIFGPSQDDRWRRMFPNLPLDPSVHSEIHNALVISRDIFEGHIFYPAMSDKTIGRDAREVSSYGLEIGIDQLYSMEEIKSTRDAECHYHLWGIEHRGVVEMRSAWTYNIMKPRAYYAQGPDCYHASKYIQEVFNILLDHLEVVHRHNRYEIPFDKMDTPDRLLTYDYSSFTSSLEQIKSFTRELATFYSGVTVVIVDTFKGPVTADLGNLLRKYNDVCNESAEFDVCRILDLEERLVLQHTTGMLGIPGNISSCTLLHGIHLVVAVGSLNGGRCVGDDALAILKDGTRAETWATFIDQVNNLGQIAAEKFEYWDYDDDPDLTGGAYCKRPMARLCNAIMQEIALVWPTIHDLIPLRDPYHKPSWKTPSQITKTFISQWSRILTKIESFNIEPSPAAIIILSEFQRWAYRKRDLGCGGARFIKSLGYSLICPKKLSPDEFGVGWKQITMDFMRQEGKELVIPCWAGVDQDQIFVEGAQFESRSTRLLGLLEKLRYLEKTQNKERIDIASITSSEYFERLLTLDYPLSYTWTVLVDCPDWVNSVSSLELMSPHERISNLIWQ